MNNSASRRHFTSHGTMLVVCSDTADPNADMRRISLSRNRQMLISILVAELRRSNAFTFTRLGTELCMSYDYRSLVCGGPEGRDVIWMIACAKLRMN